MKHRSSRPPTRAELRKALSRTLRDLRQRAGISQEGVALEAGIDRTYMSGMERGKHIPSLDIVYKMLPALGINFVDFAAELDYMLQR